MRLKRKYLFQRVGERFRLLFDNMAEGFSYHKMVYDSDGEPVDYVFLEINSGFEKQTGSLITKIWVIL